MIGANVKSLSPDILDTVQKTLILHVTVDDPISMAAERENIKWFERLLEKLGIKSNKKIKRNIKVIELNMIAATPEKVLKFFKLSINQLISERDKFGDLKVYGDSILDRAYEDSVAEALKIVAKSDEMIRLILDDVKCGDFDFIPHLSANQRTKIIEDFYAINPILDEAEKKADLRMEEVIRQNQIAQAGMMDVFVKEMQKEINRNQEL